MQYPKRPEEGVRYPGTEVRGGCELLSMVLRSELRSSGRTSAFNF